MATLNCYKYIELGIGINYNIGLAKRRLEFSSDFNNSSVNSEESLKALWASFRFGYKYQKPKGGLFIRAGFTPLIKLKTYSKFDDSKFLIPLYGLGIGYTI